MSTHIRFLTALVLGLTAGIVPASAQPTIDDQGRLAPVAWLVGGTWVGEAKAPDGSISTVELTYAWADHRKAMKYSIVRRVGNRLVPALDGICAWHPGKKQIVLWEVDNDGNVTESILVPHGTRVSFDEMLYAAAGTTQPVRAEIARQGENDFLFKAAIPKGGEWVVVFEARYTRKR
jgi:hypothetical protein